MAFGLVCDAEYLNPFANFNKWYTYYGVKRTETIVRLNPVLKTNIKSQLIHDVDLPTRDSNKLMDDAIRLGSFYVCYFMHTMK